MDNFNDLFAKGKDELLANDQIETFMQNAMLLIDSHHEMRNIMLSILCRLTIIKARDFGKACFDTLKDLMCAGKDL